MVSFASHVLKTASLEHSLRLCSYSTGFLLTFCKSVPAYLRLHCIGLKFAFHSRDKSMPCSENERIFDYSLLVYKQSFSIALYYQVIGA